MTRRLPQTPLLLALVICVLGWNVAKAEAEQAQQPQPAGAPAAPAGGTSVPTDYTIGPEDVLGIVVWREPDLSGDVTVRPDGRISLPVIGEVQAASMTPIALQEQLSAAYRKYVTDANVAVVVRAINSRKVFVTGRVTTPGAHPLVGPLTIMQAIALAGGVTEYADSKNISVLRNEGGQVRTFKFNYKDVAKGKNLEQNIRLLPGDTVVVP
ncbi:MAG TPA: polysaccharide biosynthesis/export family protein [Vicinamibacterales bacterium]|jgi:polysaccharide export outer membrane protein|nr:polysaccharide biosynthesis/export family protein [Vicinamibacterales bacterium]